MKRIIVIVGPNGVGKSTAAKEIVSQHARTAYVDSDWCRMINPFEFTKMTKRVVEDNIYCLLHNYLCCDDIQTVIFTYSWHGVRKGIYENVMRRLREDRTEFMVIVVILKCSEAENIRRAREDGRDEARIERGIKNTFSFYDEYDYPTIDTTTMTVSQVAEKIMSEII